MALTRTPPRAPVAARPQFTADQLHQRACIVCGRTDGELLPNGHVTTEDEPGRPFSWAVAACPEHQAGAA